MMMILMMEPQAKFHQGRRPLPPMLHPSSVQRISFEKDFNLKKNIGQSYLINPIDLESVFFALESTEVECATHCANLDRDDDDNHDHKDFQDDAHHHHNSDECFVDND